MNSRAKLNNFIGIEGRKLANGEPSRISAAEWLYFYHKAVDELVGAQTAVFAGYESRIRERYSNVDITDTAV